VRAAIARSPGDVTTLAWTGDPLCIREVVTRFAPTKRNRAMARWSDALCRTRNGDPFLPWRSRRCRDLSPAGQSACSAAHQAVVSGRSGPHVSTPPVPTGHRARAPAAHEPSEDHPAGSRCTGQPTRPRGRATAQLQAEYGRERVVDLAQFAYVEPSGRVTQTVRHDRGRLLGQHPRGVANDLDRPAGTISAAPSERSGRPAPC
jgi:hypothetical protein